jgi:hypothetical protein
VCSVYGIKNHDEDVRKSSSSGGLFTLLATEVIKRGGIVIGCALDENLDAKHVFVDNEANLKALRSSKYVQSSLDGVFVQAKKYLEDGKVLLFSGTPCQVAGFKRYLRKPYENLLLIDVLCHGVPSPKLYIDYKLALEQRYHGKLISLNFREKSKGWKRLYIDARFDNGKRHYRFSGFDEYLGLFLQNRSQRPACFECRFNNNNRPGDISLGDFWGIGRTYPDWDDDKGISLALTNNDKGSSYLKSVLNSTDYKELDIALAERGNKVLCAHLKGKENRYKFYQDYVNKGYKYTITKHFKEPNWFVRQYYACLRIGLDIARKLLKKGY